MQHDGCECGRDQLRCESRNAKDRGRAGTMNVGTNSVELQESYFVQAHAEVEISFSPSGEVLQAPLWPHVSRVSCLVLLKLR